jgi:ribonuclease P protein component
MRSKRNSLPGQTFTKEERLSSYREIKRLFREGKTFYQRPFRVTWMHRQADAGFPVQVMMGVPRYNFSRAVDRNRIRRYMKEAYRLNKHLLYGYLEGKGDRLIVSIAYTGKEIAPFIRIREKIILLLHRLIECSEDVTG